MTQNQVANLREMHQFLLTIHDKTPKRFNGNRFSTTCTLMAGCALHLMYHDGVMPWELIRAIQTSKCRGASALYNSTVRNVIQKLYGEYAPTLFDSDAAECGTEVTMFITKLENYIKDMEMTKTTDATVPPTKPVVFTVRFYNSAESYNNKQAYAEHRYDNRATMEREIAVLRKFGFSYCYNVEVFELIDS